MENNAETQYYLELKAMARGFCCAVVFCPFGYIESMSVLIKSSPLLFRSKIRPAFQHSFFGILHKKRRRN